MNFKTKWLILPPKERDLERLVGRSGTIHYFIQQSPFNGVLDSEYGNVFTYKIKGASHGAEVSDWIDTLIGHLDPILDVDFRPVTNKDDAELVFLAAKKVSKPWDKSTTGENVWNPKGGPGSNGVTNVLSKKTKNKSDQMATITHELGHALGLSHPKDKPDSPLFDTAITIMSYNEAFHQDFTYKDFTINDLNALVELWGAEVNNGAPIATRLPAPEQQECEEQQLQWKSVPEGVAGKDGNGEIFGSKGNDTIVGSDRIDTISSFEGDDLVDGGPGRDVLYSFGGRNRFSITEGEGVDTIHFFNQGKDVIQINHDGGKVSVKMKGNDASIRLLGKPIAILKDVMLDDAGCLYGLTVIDNTFIV